jgi:energy-converting hydrogenase B subunit D
MTWKRRKRMIEAAALNIIMPVVLVVCAIFVAVFRDLLYSVVALAVLSLLLAFQFYLMKAPDVAMAEAGIGAAVTTAIFIITLRATKRME